MLNEKEIWQKYDADEQRLTTPVTERMLELAELRPGMRVLDLATGRGEPAIPAAHRVRPSGRVVGLDISKEMLELARQRADREGVTNLELHVSDIQAPNVIAPQSFDASLARWCLMYLDDPVAALTAARRAMIPGGVMVAAVMAEPDRVPYVTFPRTILERLVELPPVDRDSPGTFYYSDLNRIHRDFESAELKVTCVEELEVPVMEAATGAEVVSWTRAFGMNRLLQDVAKSVQQAWEAELAKAAETTMRQGELIRLTTTTRIVVART